MSGRRKACGCTNHLGKQKVQHYSIEAALEAIMRRHLPRSGGLPHTTYPCPRREGVWHVRSVRGKESR